MVEVYEPTVIHYFLPLSDHTTYYVPEMLIESPKTE